LDAGGRAAFLYDLLHHDLSGVNLRDVPATEALRQQKVLSLAPNERWLFDKLMAGRWLPTHESWKTIVPKAALHDDYIHSLQRVGVERRSTQTELGMFLSKVFPGAEPVQKSIDGKRQWCWRLHDLATCRVAFDAATNSVHPWNQTSRMGATPMQCRETRSIVRMTSARQARSGTNTGPAPLVAHGPRA
jgi:hypothetical protein